jgi:AcrR family transcriptional regulator
MEGMAGLSGRKAQAARNDEVILSAARAVFVADPSAPISAVAERARVGISALYRRYPSKEELLRTLCGEGLHRYNAIAEAALDESDPWEALATFMRGVVEADTHSLTLALAGTFQPTEELRGEAQRSGVLTERLLERARAAGAVRDDITVADLTMVFEQVGAIRFGDDERTALLRRRALTLHLDAFRARPTAPLPGPPATSDELRARWYVPS